MLRFVVFILFFFFLRNSHQIRCHREDADLCDVTSSVDKMAESLGRVFPKTPDILVNNADKIVKAADTCQLLVHF